jgi:hypothetical protein
MYVFEVSDLTSGLISHRYFLESLDAVMIADYIDTGTQKVSFYTISEYPGQGPAVYGFSDTDLMESSHFPSGYNPSEDDEY